MLPPLGLGNIRLLVELLRLNEKFNHKKILLSNKFKLKIIMFDM